MLFGMVERLSQVSWHDVGMHAVLKYTDLEDLVSKNASLSIWQCFGFRAGRRGEHLADGNTMNRDIWARQYCDVKFWI